MSTAARYGVLFAILLAANATPEAALVSQPGQASAKGKSAPSQLSAADEARLNAMIAAHQRVRSRLPADDQAMLDQLTAHVRTQLFAAPPKGTLLPAAAQLVGKAVPGLTKAEAASLAEYTLGGVAGGSGQSQLLDATKAMQETQMSFNLQYLQLQSQMQHENRSYTAISNIMKTKHDTVKNSISNIR